MKTLLIAILMLLALTLFAERGEFLNSTGKDGRFHMDKRAYLCLNFSFDPGPDPRSSAHLKGELLYSGMEGHDGLDKVPACVPVTQKMIDRQNVILDSVENNGGGHMGTETIPLAKGRK